jgi:hypothetical protein
MTGREAVLLCCACLAAQLLCGIFPSCGQSAGAVKDLSLAIVGFAAGNTMGQKALHHIKET